MMCPLHNAGPEDNPEHGRSDRVLLILGRSNDISLRHAQDAVCLLDS
jgi:hypothetical protein